MAGYLKKYIGQYRVKADYDFSTKDFPRLDGSIDPAFDDLYIDCKNNIKIRHGVSNVLSCYIPSKQRGINILKQIYQDKISNNLPSENSNTQKYYEKLCNKLVETNTLVSAEVLDFEVYFEFKAIMIDYIATLVGAKTNGKSISPFSNSNLPKTKYEISNADMELYKEATRDYPTRTMTIKNEERTIVDGLVINKATKGFDSIILKSKPKKFDINKDRRLKGLSGKEYIHSLGMEMWTKYCDYLKEFGKNL